jgi:hypothetical protein
LKQLTDSLLAESELFSNLAEGRVLPRAFEPESATYDKLRTLVECVFEFRDHGSGSNFDLVLNQFSRISFDG